MPDTETIGRLLIVGAVVVAVIGLILITAGRAGLPFGRLPGDINVQRGPVTVFAPVVSCLILSVILTIVLNLVLWILRRP